MTISEPIPASATVPAFATVTEFAALLRVSTKTIWRGIDSGVLSVTRVRGSPRHRGAIRLNVAKNLARLDAHGAARFDARPERRQAS
jgi:hypothetical protein